MNNRSILVTCPPMIGLLDHLPIDFDELGISLTVPSIIQTLSEDELIQLVPRHDGWIIGDDPATSAVFKAGKAGKLKAAVKWGIGVDNVDFEACEALNLPISNTPNMFGAEVADLALGYVIGLARQTFFIDRSVREGRWPKPAGISLAGKTAAVVGYGDIGRHTVKRLRACEILVNVYDPNLNETDVSDAKLLPWPESIYDADFIIVTCALSQSSYHLLNAEIFRTVKAGVRIVNVSRGPVIDEAALISSLESRVVHSAALDVFEVEPLSSESHLRKHELCVFGSHNASNTHEAVVKTSLEAVERLMNFLDSVEK